jgi:hypothetical protein
VTLVACLYTSIHLNVSRQTGTWRRLRQKLKWVLMGLLVPELLLYCASGQFLAAQSLVTDMNKMEKEKEKNGGIRKPPFDLKYGLFVVMGGFEVSVSEVYDDLEKVHRQMASFNLLSWDTPSMFQMRTSRDKGKANLIQKSLVMLQVTWMATQCITRRAYGLPLTLLEIHTMVHVICALTMYSFWFYVSSSTQISPILAS